MSKIKNKQANDSTPENTTNNQSKKKVKTDNTVINNTEVDAIESLKLELKQAQQSVKDNWDKVIRGKAEMENLVRRNTKNLENAHKYALEGFVKALLTVSDSLAIGLQSAQKKEASIQSVKEGLEMINKTFIATLENFGVTEINPINEKFNPEHHEAMTMIAMPDKQSQSIVEVVQTGAMLNGRLIRPARVVVAQ